MTIVLFDREEDAYWWILCLEKFFKEHETPKSLKILKAIGALKEYAAAVVHAVKDVCNRRNVKHHVICSESGRAIVSYHSILIFEAIGATLRGYLQHRGQEGAGIVTVNNNILQSIIGVGLVSDVFNESMLDQLPGSLAIGHVRYSTAGQSMLKNVQPFVVGYHFGSVGVAHNGNLVNYRTLRAKLEEKCSIFNTTSDTEIVRSEIVLHLIATLKHRPFILKIIDACEKIKGAYSIEFVMEDKLVAVRDPFEFRPLVMGRRNNGVVIFASETCALDSIEATYEREVFPSEVVVVDDNGIQSLCLMSHPQPKQCIFEHIYIVLPNSVAFGRSVYESRRRFGEVLPTGQPWSSLIGCSSELAVFYENGPFEIANKMSLTWNEYDWDKAIFAAHPEYATHDIFVTGESYAGHYVLVFTARVHKGSKAKEIIHINSKGFAIVNGFTNFGIHYKAYADYVLDMGIIEQPDYDSINKVLVPAHELAIKLCGTDGKISCTTSYFVCNTIFIPIMSHATHINYYDIRKKCGGILCYDFSNKEKFLNQGFVRDALGVGDIDFVSCSSIVYQAMLVDCRYVFIILILAGIILIPVLLLVALTNGGGKKQTVSKATFNELGELSMGNITASSARLWACFNTCYWISLVSLFFLWKKRACAEAIYVGSKTTALNQKVQDQPTRLAVLELLERKKSGQHRVLP
ncbi:uncharacterized protein LOC131641012 [Vicia villosa]|uniref:uncharacterized protein LOC131641012 n=1 Tax=Vicia villosa TaxID=3911 RepID=UPI00273AE62D|nr:uncharacterized protein LOC131641012 [Vicia villosa]